MPYVKENYKDLIPKIIDSIINIITKPPEMSISSEPEQKLDIQEFLKDINQKEKVFHDKKIVTIVNSEIEEYSSFIEFIIFIFK